MHSIRAGSRTAGTLAVTDVQLAEAAQIPLAVGQVEFAGFVHAQPDLGHQSAGGVVAGGWGELPAARQVLPPPGEQPIHLLDGGRDAQLALLRVEAECEVRAE